MDKKIKNEKNDSSFQNPTLSLVENSEYFYRHPEMYRNDLDEMVELEIYNRLLTNSFSV